MKKKHLEVYKFIKVIILILTWKKSLGLGRSTSSPSEPPGDSNTYSGLRMALQTGYPIRLKTMTVCLHWIAMTQHNAPGTQNVLNKYYLKEWMNKCTKGSERLWEGLQLKKLILFKPSVSQTYLITGLFSSTENLLTSWRISVKPGRGDTDLQKSWGWLHQPYKLDLGVSYYKPPTLCPGKGGNLKMATYSPSSHGPSLLAPKAQEMCGPSFLSLGWW